MEIPLSLAGQPVLRDGKLDLRPNPSRDWDLFRSLVSRASHSGAAIPIGNSVEIQTRISFELES